MDTAAYESRSLRPLICGPDLADDDRAFFLSPSIGWTGVRRGRFKYLGRRNLYFPARALFDMVEDPGETRDLADDPRYAAVAEELEAVLDQELARPVPW